MRGKRRGGRQSHSVARGIPTSLLMAEGSSIEIALRDPQHILVKQSQARITPEAAVFDADRRLVYHGRIDNLYEDFGRARKTATTHELDDAIQAAINGKSMNAQATPAVGCYISDLE